MRFLADENVKWRLIAWLEQDGHDIVVAEKGVKNSQLFRLANRRQRVLITNDTDFLNTALHPLKSTSGRIVLRVFPPTLENQKEGLAAFLAQPGTADCRGKLIEIWRMGFEIRTEIKK